MNSVVITGRLPGLSIAELESLCGETAIASIGDGFVVLNTATNDIEFERLGGSIKLAHIVDKLPTTDWSSIERHLVKTIPKSAKGLPDGKLTLGLSVYDLGASLKQLERTALTLKKIIRSSERPVRIVPNKAPALSTAQVLHNQLTSELGWEIVLIKHGNNTLVCKTTDEQDIEAYTARDQARPRRDAKVGMLPPKLAQTIINLATPRVGALEMGNGKWESANTNNPLPITLSPAPKILDPFCGTGVVLQEALLMGYDVYGTDLEPRMVQYSADNIDWLNGWHPKSTGQVRIEVGDATSYTWQQPIDAIAAETYLGEPLAVLPPREALERIISEVNQLHIRALKNIARQIAPGTRLCLAVPAWRERGTFRHLPCLGNLNQLGFARVAFRHVSNDDLLYYREDQIVARELLVLQKTS